MNKTLIAICAFCVLAIYAMGLRMDLAKKEAKYSKQHADLLLAQIASRTELVKNLGVQASEHYKNLEIAQNEIDRLANSVAVSTGQLHINATCPELPDTPTPRVVDNGDAARLTRAAEQNYLLLRKRIEIVNAQLTACQDYARAVSEK